MKAVNMSAGIDKAREEIQQLQKVNRVLFEACQTAFMLFDDLAIEVGALAERTPSNSYYDRLCGRFGDLRDLFDAAIQQAKEEQRQ